MKPSYVCRSVFLFAVVWAGSLTVRAQAPTPTQVPVGFAGNFVGGKAEGNAAEQPPKGLTLSERFEGSTSDGTTVLDMNTALGYNFGEHFGVDVGVPVFFLVPNGQKGIASNTVGLGNVSIGVHTDFELGPVSYSSSITAGFPTASTTKGLSTGRVIVDWDNRFEHSWGNFTPYIDISLGNGINDVAMLNRLRAPVQRPYITLGKEVQIEGGADVKLGRKTTLSVSGYDVVPWGTQKVYSLVVRRGQTGKGKTRHQRVYETWAVSEGSADLDRDHGINSSVGFQATKYMGLNAGYSRSVRFASNSFSFGVGFNLSRLFHGQGQQ
ncbi:MAG TPA: hypothetical protein VOA41_20620 [Candidatus Dormibacteraeota bacterium]|nr:hypothetical protein [Candidatus Dormibacteraeota bacterium]